MERNLMQGNICYEPLTWISEEAFAQRIIVCAANKYTLTDGKEIIIPCVRHTNPVLSVQINYFMQVGLLEKGWCRPDDQGFIDQYYNWWSREDALVIAEFGGQVNHDRNGHHRDLFSEGLY